MSYLEIVKDIKKEIIGWSFIQTQQFYGGGNIILYEEKKHLIHLELKNKISEGNNIFQVKDLKGLKKGKKDIRCWGT